MEKTYSQKIARVFEIVCYVLLAPTGLSLIFPLLYIVGGTLQGNLWISFFGFIPLLIVAPGFVLLVGYFRHSRGRVKEKNIPALWLGTAIYNFVLLLPPLYFVSVGFHEANFGSSGEDSLLLFGAALAVVFGYLAAIVYSLKAYSFEKRKKIL